MKIKEVCDKTGLTERAVRLYLEKGLVHPQSQWRQGRTYHDYQQQDIQRLTEIAALRRVGFSLEEIAALLQQNQQVDIILEHHCRKLEEETRQSEQQAQLLGQLAETSWPDGSTLARAILRADTSKVPVDTEPDFGEASDGTGRPAPAPDPEMGRDHSSPTGTIGKHCRIPALAGISAFEYVYDDGRPGAIFSANLAERRRRSSPDDCPGDPAGTGP